MLQVYEKIINDAQGLRFPLSPQDDVTPVRLAHWRNSRQALTLCLQEAGLTEENNLHHGHLAIKDHHHLLEWPNYLVSLAHTRGAATALLTHKTPALLGVGIDIEARERPLKEGILQKYSHPEDQGLGPLELWCAKEAAYKAASYFWQREKTFILKDIKVIDHSFWIDDRITGEVFHRIQDDFLITKAFVYNTTAS